ncbi:hypothetical protein U0036_05845 [Cupriavidus oxalaticus]|nr:hypothetical protein [Cupriavidus oxalaticus]WQD84032.1 hypothetical protein U0036_05845 [Cupriavidus oxalaticus]
MVRAILDGRKTQTRRVVKLPHNNPLGVWEPTTMGGENGGRTAAGETVPLQGAIWHTRTGECLCSPYGQPGDRLWVRETWAQPVPLDPGPTVYRADYPACVPPGYERIPTADEITWKPSIHMPRALCRLRLEVTGVRVERLNDCSEADAVAEGLHILPASGRYVVNPGEQYLGAADHDPRVVYADLWDRINGAGAWDANPWVWVVEFRRVQS